MRGLINWIALDRTTGSINKYRIFALRESVSDHV